jgi:hypothetical protein
VLLQQRGQPVDPASVAGNRAKGMVVRRQPGGPSSCWLARGDAIGCRLVLALGALGPVPAEADSALVRLSERGAVIPMTISAPSASSPLPRAASGAADLAAG